MISTRVGSAVARARRSGALTSAEPQEWSVLARGKLKPYHIVCCESTGAVADSAPADAVTVTASKWDEVAGLYIKQPPPSGADGASPVYANEQDKTFMWRHDGRWCISNSAAASAASASSALAASALSTAPSPEDADWSRAGLVVLGVEHVSCGKTDREAPASDVPTFSDSEFPADQPSLGSPSQVRANKGWDKVMWRRALALSPPEREPPLHLLPDPSAAASSSSPLLSAAIGEGWLLSALGALAEFPSFFRESVFVNGGSVAADGKYTLRLYDAASRQWREVTIDDQVPCRDTEWFEMPRALLSGCLSVDPHVLLVEKALAKLSGSYAGLLGGTPARALLALTGCEEIVRYERDAGAVDGAWLAHPLSTEPNHVPLKSFKTTQRLSSDQAAHTADALFALLKLSYARGHVMAATTVGEAEAKRSDGLVACTSYPLLRVHEDGAGTKLLQLRNPWGPGQEWNGAWSDGAAEWSRHAALGDAIGYTADGSDGRFWMGLDDFRQRFLAVEVCKKEMPREGNKEGEEVDRQEGKQEAAASNQRKEAAAAAMPPPPPQQPPPAVAAAEQGDDPYDFSGASARPSAPSASTAEDDPYDFGSAPAVPHYVASSSATRRRLQAAATASTVKQTIGAVGVARRGEEASAAALAAEQAEQAELAAGIGLAGATPSTLPAMPQPPSGRGVISNAHEDEAFDAEESYEDDGFEPEAEEGAEAAVVVAAVAGAARTTSFVPPSAAQRARGGEAAATVAAATPAAGIAGQAAAAAFDGAALGDDEDGLRQRLALARARHADFTERSKQAIAAIAAAERGRGDLQRRVDNAYDRLASQLEGTPGIADPRFEHDEEVEEAEERLGMLQQRLRAAKGVLKRQAEVASQLKGKRQLYEASRGLPMPAPRPVSAAARSGDGGGGGGGGLPAVGGLGKVISKKDEARSVEWLYESSRRKKADFQARAEEERDREISATVKTRRLGQEEQARMVERLEAYAKKKKEREEAAIRQLDEEAAATAHKATGHRKMGGKSAEGMLNRLYKAPVSQARDQLHKENLDRAAADAVGAGRARDHPKARAARAMAKLDAPGAVMPGGNRSCANPFNTPFFPATLDMGAAAGGRAGGAPGPATSTPRTAATRKIAAGKMLDADEMAAFKSAVQEQRPPLPPQRSERQQPQPPPEGEQFELTVPEGYAGGDDLPVQLPDGRQVLISVPDGLGPGAEFIALLPRTAAAEAAAARPAAASVRDSAEREDKEAKAKEKERAAAAAAAAMEAERDQQREEERARVKAERATEMERLEKQIAEEERQIAAQRAAEERAAAQQREAQERAAAQREAEERAAAQQREAEERAAAQAQMEKERAEQEQAQAAAKAAEAAAAASASASAGAPPPQPPLGRRIAASAARPLGPGEQPGRLPLSAGVYPAVSAPVRAFSS